MARRIKFAVEEFYHVYNRGVDKRVIFIDDHDYHRAMLLFRLCNSETPVDIAESFFQGKTIDDLWNMDIGGPVIEIGAWCLMPNHFHLVIREIQEGGISSFMHAFGAGYATYFNNRYERSGSLFEGRFKAHHIEKDVHFQHLFSYVHLNPVKLVPGELEWKSEGVMSRVRVQELLDRYPYSSLTDYRFPNKRQEAGICKRTNFPWEVQPLLAMLDEAVAWSEEMIAQKQLSKKRKTGTPFSAADK